MNMTSSRLFEVYQGDSWAIITFSSNNAIRVLHHDNDPLVITMQDDNLDVNRVLIDPWSSSDILVWDSFEKLQLYPGNIQEI